MFSVVVCVQQLVYSLDNDAVQSQEAPGWSGSLILPEQPAQAPEFTVWSSTCEYLWTEESFFSYLRATRSLSSHTIGLSQDPSASNQLPQI